MNAKDLMLRFFIAVTGLATACSGPAPTQNYGAAVPVNVYQVQREGAAYVDAYPATIVALSQVDVRSEVNGFITAVHFEDGTRVRKGQKLYEIDRSKFLAAYNQAKANLEMAEINQDKAGKDAGRYTRLNQANAVPKQRYEYALTDFENAKQQVALARAQLSNASADLGHSVIRAPFDGTIGVSLVKPGTFIRRGQTQLNTISSAGPVAVDFG
jgi:membrane fusion protein (multidrug efflux system)